MEDPNAVPAVNPLLDRIQMPGETFTLPSGGIFYDNGELDPSVTNAEVRVNPMTALDEIIMKTPDMLFSGDAVRQVFARCIPSILKPDMILAKDVDFLIVCLRKVSYGPAVRVNQKHNCEDAKQHHYDIDVTDFIKRTRRIDPTVADKRFTTEMPNGQRVTVEPIRFGHFVEVMQLDADRRDQVMTPEQQRDRTVRSLARVVRQVDEITDEEMIVQWLSNIRPEFLRKIEDKIEETVQWGTDFNTTVKCHDCGKPFTFDLPMNPLAFFT